jgi:hypothetical protein
VTEREVSQLEYGLTHYILTTTVKRVNAPCPFGFECHVCLRQGTEGNWPHNNEDRGSKPNSKLFSSFLIMCLSYYL